jgi:hypothetical protein
MKTLVITTLAVGLIGCASNQSKTVLRIVDPYSQIVYDLTDEKCPRSTAYPYVFRYQGAIQGCYWVSERDQKMYFLSSSDWQTHVTYTYAQLVQSKQYYESTLAYALQSTTPSYPPPSTKNTLPQSTTGSTMVQCFTNGFGTVTCQ